jgi:hypothetical protein
MARIRGVHACGVENAGHLVQLVVRLVIQVHQSSIYFVVYILQHLLLQVQVLYMRNIHGCQGGTGPGFDTNMLGLGTFRVRADDSPEKSPRDPIRRHRRNKGYDVPHESHCVSISMGMYKSKDPVNYVI